MRYFVEKGRKYYRALGAALLIPALARPWRIPGYMPDRHRA